MSIIIYNSVNVIPVPLFTFYTFLKIGQVYLGICEAKL